jgi:hypothetical protein
MMLSVEVPDQIAHNVHLEGSQGNRRALEMLALEGYREGMLSRGAVAKMLDLSYPESEQFLLITRLSTILRWKNLTKERPTYGKC